MMPSLTAWMINELGFRTDTVQLPIAQLGCAAGTAAINRASDFCRAHPGASALIVACEFCSLCYQPDDLDVGSLLSNGLFGDAVAAAVVRGDGHGTGVRLEAQTSHVMPGTDTWICYEVKETGFHFRLNKGVPGTMQQVMPELTQFVRGQGYDLAKLDFHVIHTGGPRVLDALRSHGGVPAEALGDSWETLSNHGNIASAAVLDVLRRVAEKSPAEIRDRYHRGLRPRHHDGTGAGQLGDRSSASAGFPHARGRVRPWHSVDHSRSSRSVTCTGTGQARPSPSTTTTCSAC